MHVREHCLRSIRIEGLARLCLSKARQGGRRPPGTEHSLFAFTLSRARLAACASRPSGRLAALGWLGNPAAGGTRTRPPPRYAASRSSNSLRRSLWPTCCPAVCAGVWVLCASQRRQVAHSNGLPTPLAQRHTSHGSYSLSLECLMWSSRCPHRKRAQSCGASKCSAMAPTAHHANGVAPCLGGRDCTLRTLTHRHNHRDCRIP
jgi:hypothetical protein